MDFANSTNTEEYPHPFANGAWRAWQVGEPGKPDAQTAQEEQDKRSECHKDREESFERCDTDGFLSQWANGVQAGVHSLRKEIAENGGLGLFPGLYRRDTGERVRAKLIEGRYGFCWAFCDENGKFTGKFLNDARTKRAALYKRGYVVLGEWVPAGATTRGEGTGLSGRAWAAMVRLDKGYPEKTGG